MMTIWHWLTDQLAGRLDNSVDRQPQLLVDLLIRGGCSKSIQADHDPRISYPALPTQG